MKFSTVLGWSLVQFLWQGAVIALLLAIALRATKLPRLRHAFAVLAMLAMLAVFITTLCISLPIGVTFDTSAATVINRATGPIPAWRPTGRQWNELLPWLSAAWCGGVVLLIARRAGGWWLLHKMRNHGLVAIPPEWRSRLHQLEQRMRISQPVAWFESASVDAPVILGWLKPVLLTPIGMAAAMPIQQVESILLHELAHLVRRDPLINMLQSAVESLLFYHPAVWWVSRVIREERETCCDDLVVAIQGDPKQYAQALLTLEEQRAIRLQPALAANGGDLMRRIERLAGKAATPRGPGEILTLICVLTLLGCLSATSQLAPTGPYQKWLTEDAFYIIDDAEKTAYKKLTSDEERAKFIEQFWLRRDPTPATPNVNEFKEQHYRRIAYANERFRSKISGWKTDLGRVYIVYGPPDEIEIHPGKKQSWLYRQIKGIGANVILSFTFKDGEYIWDSDPSVRH